MNQHFANIIILVVITESTGRFSFPKEITDIQRRNSARECFQDILHRSMFPWRKTHHENIAITHKGSKLKETCYGASDNC